MGRGRIPIHCAMLRFIGGASGPLALCAAAMICVEVLAADGSKPVEPNATKDGPVSELRREAEHGDFNAQYLLGCCYNGDFGCPKDPVEASKWWKKAAEKGVADAQYCLGLSLYLGQGVHKDTVEAAKWWRRAAVQNHADAQYFLGLSYCAGLGVQKSTPLAIYWLHRSASQGNKAALELLSKIGLAPG